MRFRTKTVMASAILVALVLYQTGPWRREGAKVRVPDSADEAPVRTDPSTGHSSEQDPAPNSQSAIANPQSKDQAATNWLFCLLTNNCDASTLPREAIDRWLASGRTNAEDLLAARQAGGGIEFL